MTLDGFVVPVELVAALTIDGAGVTVDYTGTSPVSDRGINVPKTYCEAYTGFGLACAIAPEVPNNAGSLSVFRVEAPEGCILNAPRPCPVATRHVIGQMLPDVVFGCLHQAVPGRVPAEGTSCLWTLTMGRGPAAAGASLRGFMLNAVHNGGTGARATADGLSATAYPSGVRGTPVEITESISPLVYRRRELRPGSGGAGRQRGGHGQIIEIEALDGARFGLWAAFDRTIHPARGRGGSGHGALGELVLDDGRPLLAKGYQEVPAGRRLIVLTPGGGGYGPEAERAPEEVAAERAAGLLGE
jgi:N-methylhydantoinase B